MYVGYNGVWLEGFHCGKESMMESSLCKSFGQTGHGRCTWYNIYTTNKDPDVPLGGKQTSPNKQFKTGEGYKCNRKAEALKCVFTICHR